MKRINGLSYIVGLCWIVFSFFIVVLPARAQDKNGCKFLCSPELKFEPTGTFDKIASRPDVVTFQNGQAVDTATVSSEQAFEMVFALDVPTTIPRMGFTFEAIWTPFSKTDTNPFTGRTSGQLGEQINDNPVELEAEMNLTLLRSKDTNGWGEVHFDIIDKFSQAEDPDATAIYTHKLNLELDAGIAPFNRLPEENWLRNVELEGSLDYVATGLPDAGDRLGNQLFLEDASPWSFSVVLVLPIVPF